MTLAISKYLTLCGIVTKVYCDPKLKLLNCVFASPITKRFCLIFVYYFFLLFLHLVCYGGRYGSRGFGHGGFSSIGLTSDARDLEWQRLEVAKISVELN